MRLFAEAVAPALADLSPLAPASPDDSSVIPVERRWPHARDFRSPSPAITPHGRHLAMTIPFGIGFSPNVGAPRVIDAALLAERLGYHTFWITDSHLAAREAVAMLGALAVSTHTVTLGTGVSHLAGRHPTVLASAFTTLDELAPGRVRLGIGVGDSGPMNLGVPRTSVSDLERAIVQIKDLSQGRTVEHADGGRPWKLGFGSPERNVPVFVASSGTRTQRMIGRVADGALISGMPSELPNGIAAVRAGEQEAGRAPGSTRIVLWTTVAVDEDGEAARTACAAASPDAR